MDHFSSLSVEVSEAIAHIRFTRPELHNRFDELAHSELPKALAGLAARADDIAALVISAEGKSFSAGGDLDMMLRANASDELTERIFREGDAIIESLVGAPYPIIAAVQGAAVGLGASVIGCCDIVIAARGAKIADPHVVLGLVAGDGGLLGWSQSIGVMRAKRYLLTGDAISAEDAHAMGLVSDLTDHPDEVLPAALALATRIARLPRGGVRGTKKAFAQLSRDLYGAAYALSSAFEKHSLRSDEVRRTVEALRARRDAPR
jgi:enoyl-CoA hydratase